VVTPDLQSASALRRSLEEELQRGDAQWIRMDGLGVDDPDAHRGLQSGVRRTGVHRYIVPTPPGVVVLDWKHLAAVSADGLAFAAVLLQALCALKTRVICCPAQDPHVSETLAHTFCAALRYKGVEWLPEFADRADAKNPRVLLGPVYCFGGARGVSVGKAIDEAESALELAGWARVPELNDLIVEIAQNIGTHADASHAALCVLIDQRRRPPRLQVGVADDGVGIPTAMLSDPRYTWLQSYSPARANETVIVRQLSGRGADRGGGVLGELYGTLIAEAGATVTLRSGEGWVRIGGNDRTPRRQSLTYGLGTQLLVELPLTRR